MGKNQNKIKIVFFDIDGTLIDMQKKQITEKTLEMLKRLKKRGIRICLATGRGPMGLPHFEGVAFDAYLTFNGSYCFDGQRSIFSNSIAKEDLKKIISNAAGIKRPVSVATKDRMLANGKDKDLVDYYAIAKKEVNVSDEFDQVIQEEKVYQMMVGCTEKEYGQMLKGVSGARIVAWWDRAADIIPANSGKGLGIQKILEYYGLDRSEALAFGDGNNDIEMLQTVGTGVAMENASEQLKQIADEICGHVAEDGVYYYCTECNLI